jgi:hypothetical protein
MRGAVFGYELSFEIGYDLKVACEPAGAAIVLNPTKPAAAKPRL